MFVCKIDAMHKRFGKIDGKRCGDCCNLHEWLWSKKYFKCSVYGMSRSTATDWAKKWTACGMFNKKQEPRKKGTLSINEPDNTPMEGQIEMEVSNDNKRA